MCCGGMRKTLMSSQSGCDEVPMPSSSVEFANSMQSCVCVYYESSRCDTEKSLHCVLTWPDSVITCVAPARGLVATSSARASLSGLVAVSEENVFRPCLSRYIASSSENDKFSGFGFLGMFARRT